MRHYPSDTAETYLVGPVDVARWEQYGLQDTLPFGAMWYSIPAGESSPQDCHPEMELSIVITGTASVEASGVVTEAPQGTAFLLDGSEAHIIHNHSAERLLIFTTYWMPLAGQPAEAVTAGAGQESGS
jgi:cupin domain